MLLPGSELKNKDQLELFKMASYFGFRELMSGIWIRPNNLSQNMDELAKKLPVVHTSMAL